MKIRVVISLLLLCLSNYCMFMAGYTKGLQVGRSESIFKFATAAGLNS
jgi:hypothetical protein